MSPHCRILDLGPLRWKIFFTQLGNRTKFLAMDKSKWGSNRGQAPSAFQLLYRGSSSFTQCPTNACTVLPLPIICSYILHCTENPEMKLRSLVPNFYIQVFESYRGIYKSLSDTWMWKLGDRKLPFFFWKYCNRTEQFHFSEYINRNQTFIMDSHRPFICSVNVCRYSIRLCILKRILSCEIRKIRFLFPTSTMYILLRSISGKCTFNAAAANDDHKNCLLISIDCKYIEWRVKGLCKVLQ
jgi:hypothetical protein